MTPPVPRDVQAWLAALPDARREAIGAIRKTIADNIDPAFREGLQHGMLSWFVPHDVYPAGYHANPKQPLPFASVGNQKHHIGIYLFCLYQDPQLIDWFRRAWADARAAGRAGRLDMGKSCIRVKKLDALPLPLLGELIAKVGVTSYIATYEAVISRRPGRKGRRR